jgi:hypothetical protein
MTADDELDSDGPNAGDYRTDSFVVRVWVEESGGTHASPAWRGHITHVVSRERRYLRSLEDIAVFIIPYLKQLGVRFNWCRQTRRWLKHR